jgi:hypothetical protein
MKTYNLEFREWEPIVRRQQAPLLEGNDEDLIGYDNGVPVLYQSTNWEADQDLLTELTRTLRFGIKYQNPTAAARLSGIKASNEYFGTVPPQPTRRRYACREARLYTSLPHLKGIIDQLTKQMFENFQLYFPDECARHTELVEQSILPDWWIADTPFTSGIINDKSALPYHKDSGNLQGTWSMMLCLRNGTAGGGLHIPEYDINLGIPDRSLTIFEGQRLWHGVNPLVYRKNDPYRFTLVWYVKEQIRNCSCIKDEPLRAAKKATEVQEGYVNND